MSGRRRKSVRLPESEPRHKRFEEKKPTKAEYGKELQVYETLKEE